MALLLVACSHAVEISHFPGTSQEDPPFQGNKGERYRLSDINITAPVVLDSIHTAWLSTEGEIQVFNHVRTKEIERIDGKEPITNASYHPRSFYWVEADQKKNFVRFDLLTGRERWRIEGFSSATDPVLVDSLCIFTGVNGELRAVDTLRGETVWERKFDARLFVSPVLFGKEMILATDSGALRSLDPATGQTRWRFGEITSAVMSLSEMEGTVYLGTFDGQMISLDPADKSVNWAVETDYQVRNVPLVLGEKVYWVNAIGELYSIEKENGTAELLRYFGTPTTGPPVYSAAGILISGRNGVLYQIENGSGQILDQMEFDGRLRNAPLFFRGEWYVGVEDHWIYEIQ